MDSIFDTDATFKFENVTMTTPTSVGSGTFFSKIFVSKKPLYIQSPKCKTRQGIVQSGKKIHADLVFTNDDEEFIQWMESLEQTVKKNIYNNRGKWFDTDMDEDDVDSYMTPTMKIFKSGKQYLMRVNVSQRIGTAPLKIYDEDEASVEMGAINDTTSIITILEIQGVRCSSKSFQIDIELKQIMVLKPVNLFEKCIIKSKAQKPETLVSRGVESSIPSKEEELTIENTLAKVLETDQELQEPLDSATKSPMPLAEARRETSDSATKSPMPLEESDNNKGGVIGELLVPLRELRSQQSETSFPLEEFDLTLDAIENADTVQLKEKTEVYYQMYREAKQKAKLAKSLALSSYMEARRIKNLYMLDDIDSSDDDDEDFDLAEMPSV
jgi:hypothetical protein